jgi:hypothetical protein
MMLISKSMFSFLRMNVAIEVTKSTLLQGCHGPNICLTYDLKHEHNETMLIFKAACLDTIHLQKSKASIRK